MADIVERLRHAHTRNLPLDDGLMGQAAYEIERLRRIIDTIHPQMQATIDRLTKDNADISAACNEGWGEARKRQDQIRNLEAEIERLRLACTTMNTEICQRLGKALGYPWFKDDQENFPGATEENGACTGEHVAESIAAEAADWIGKLEAQRDRAERLVNEARAERDEAVATLTLYRAENGCTRGQRTTQWCGEATRLRRAWLRVLQDENSCEPTGNPCKSKRCGCLAELEALVKETGHE